MSAASPSRRRAGNRSLRPFVRFAWPYRGRLVVAGVLTAVLTILAVAPPLLIAAMVDVVIAARRVEYFWWITGAMLVLPLLTSGLRYWQTTAVAYVGEHFVLDLRDHLYHHLLRLSLRFYGKHSSGMLVNRLIGDTGVLQHCLTAQTLGILSDLVAAGIAIAATFWLNWRLAIVLLLIVYLFVWNYRRNIQRIRTATKGYQGAVDRMSGGIQNRLTTAMAVKAFGTEGREHREFRGTLGSGLELIQNAMFATTSFNINTQFIHQGGHSLLYFMGCGLVLRGEMTYGEIIAFTAYATQLLWPAVRFSMIAKQFQDVGIAVERLGELLREIPEVRDDPSPVRVRRLRGDVDFDAVRFWYDEGKPVLHDFELHVRAGMTVALIGPTGCGKSTVLSLIMRFFDVCQGELRLDNIPVRKLALADLRRQFGIVLQEPMLFTVSVADNIRYGRPTASRAEIEAAAKVAEIHDFILTLPQGYDTLIGSEGVDLSVGQKQRITIARAVLADPAILIMDEATSALDSESERAIQIAMERVLQHRTSFIVAHRLSTIRRADVILLLDQGRIRERGTHEELMAMEHGRYRELYLKHMGQGVIEE